MLLRRGDLHIIGCVLYINGFGVLYCILSYLHLYFKCDQIPSIYGCRKIVIFIVLHFILGEKGTNHLVRSMKRYIGRDFFFLFDLFALCIHIFSSSKVIWGVQLSANANVKFFRGFKSFSQCTKKCATTGFSLRQEWLNIDTFSMRKRVSENSINTKREKERKNVTLPPTFYSVIIFKCVVCISSVNHLSLLFMSYRSECEEGILPIKHDNIHNPLL